MIYFKRIALGTFYILTWPLFVLYWCGEEMEMSLRRKR
jgi:hypothetical protein